MTPHWTYIVDIETNGRMVAMKVFMKPSHRHPLPFSKRPAGHRRRVERRLRRALKKEWLYAN